MHPNHIDIAIHRNADYLQEWQFCDNQGQPINIDDIDFSMKVRENAGQGPVVVTADVVRTDVINGRVQFKILGAAFSAIEGQTELVKLAYDIVMTYSDGIKFVPVEGHIILVPGVTY